MKITTIIKRASAAVAAAAMTAAMTATLSFTALTGNAILTNAAVNEDKSGILQVEVHYQPSGQEDLLVQTGTGFLINRSTLLTCDHVVTIDDEDKPLIAQYFTEKMGEEHKFDEDYVKVQVAILGDVKEPATITRQSHEGDYAILTINTDLTTKNPLALTDSDSVQQTQEVYALGFPSNITDFQNHTNYTAYVADDVTVTQGTVSKTNYVFNNGGNTKLVQHSANISEGNSGGPLVNSDGNVVGINQGVYDNFYYAIEINQIRELLDTLGIEYNYIETGSKTTTTVSEEAETPTLATVAPATTAAVKPDPVITAPAVEDEGSGFDIKWIIIIAIVLVVLIIIAIIVAILLMSRKKPTPVAAPPVPARPMGGPVNQIPQAPVSPAPYNPGVTAADTGAGETSLLNSGAGETSVLGGGSAMGKAILIRKKTGTNVPISSPDFIIGKENSRVNYCVNNNAVSRQHAKITVNGGNYFITDMNSSNFTYINGRQIPANTPQPIHTGDVIKLADEEFEFRG